MTRTLGLPVFFVVSLSSVAFAETPLPQLPPADSATPPPPAPTAPPTTDASPVSNAPLDEATWRARYAEASAKLSNGDYANALTAFTVLVAAAPTEATKNLALAQVKVASDLAKGTTPPAPTFPPPPSTQELPPPAVAPVAPPPVLTTRSLDELIWLYTSTLSYGFMTGLLVDAGVHENPADTNRDSHVAVPIATLATGALLSVVIAVSDSKYTFRYGVPQSITSGMYIGIEQGFFWSIWDASRTNTPTPTYLHTAGTLWGLTTAGAVLGGTIGGIGKVTPGQASWTGSLSFWPAEIFGSIALASTGADGTRANLVKGERNMGIVGGVTGLIGVVTGAATSVWLQPSVARSRYIDLLSFAGGLLGGSVCITMHNCNEAGVFGGIALGSGIGFIGTLIATQLVGDLNDPIARHFPGLKDVTPTITPVNGGATLGFGGSL
jgi:hypothetical protein